MSVQTETLGYGWQLQKGNTNDYNTATVWTTLVSELTAIKPPASKVSDIPTRHFNSPGQADTFTPGWTSGGDAEFTSHYFYSEATAIYAAKGVTSAYRVIAPEAETGGVYSTSSSSSGGSINGAVNFNGYINDIDPKLNLDGLAEIDFKIKVSGPVLFF